MIHVSVSDDSGRSASFSVDMGDATVADVSLQRKVRAVKHPKPGMMFVYDDEYLKYFAPEEDSQTFVYIVDYVTDGKVFGRVLSLVSRKYEGDEHIYYEPAPFNGGRSILDWSVEERGEDKTERRSSIEALAILYYPSE